MFWLLFTCFNLALRGFRLACASRWCVFSWAGMSQPVVCCITDIGCSKGKHGGKHEQNRSGTQRLARRGCLSTINAGPSYLMSNRAVYIRHRFDV